MNLKSLKKQNLPDLPGVYFFKKDKEILYIGKATSLRDRVRSYFSNGLIKTRGSRIVDMVTLANKVHFEKTDSVLEALLLESSLIKKHQPKYNAKEKDNKSYNHVVVTYEKFPRVLIIREQDLKKQGAQNSLPKIKYQFGPFPNAGQLKEALKLIQKMFPFFDTSKPVDNLKSIDQKRINLKISLGLYPDIFSEKISATEYKKNISNIRLFFEGKKKQILKKLQTEMKQASKDQEFEKAARIKKTIFALNHINDISLISQKEENISEQNFRIEAYDIAHLSGKETVGVMTVVENGQIKNSDYRKFLIRESKEQDDYAALSEILNRRFDHQEWPYPNLIVIDGGKGQLNRATKTLKKFGIEIPIVSVVKDEKHKPRQILGANKNILNYEKDILISNFEAHRFAVKFHRKRRSGMLK